MPRLSAVGISSLQAGEDINLNVLKLPGNSIGSAGGLGSRDQVAVRISRSLRRGSLRVSSW
jgi:hypothetical protein